MFLHVSILFLALTLEGTKVLDVRTLPAMVGTGRYLSILAGFVLFSSRKSSSYQLNIPILLFHRNSIILVLVPGLSLGLKAFGFRFGYKSFVDWFFGPF